MESYSADKFEQYFGDAFRDAKLNPSDDLWDKIATSNELESNSFEGDMKHVFSEAELKPSDNLWHQITQSPELTQSFEKQITDKFQYANIVPPNHLWKKIEWQLHGKSRSKKIWLYVSGVAATLLLVSGLWWYNVENQRLEYQKPVASEDETPQFQAEISKNNTSPEKKPSRISSREKQILGKSNKNATIIQSDHRSQNTIGSEAETLNHGQNLVSDVIPYKPEENAQDVETIKKYEPSQIIFAQDTVKHSLLLEYLTRLDVRLVVDSTSSLNTQPVIALFDIPNLSHSRQKLKLVFRPFLSLLAKKELFNPNFQGNAQKIEHALQSNLHPFTKGKDSYDDNLHQSLEDSIFDIKSYKYGVEFGVEIDRIIKKGTLGLVSGLYLTQTAFTVQNSFTRKKLSQAVSESEKTIIQNTLQNRTRLISIPLQLVYTSTGKSNFGLRLGTGIEADFVLRNQWINPSQELEYQLGAINPFLNYTLSGGVLYRIGKHAMIGINLTHKKALSDAYRSDYLSSKPSSVGYGGYMTIKF